MVFESLVKTLQSVERECIAIDIQDEREYLQLILFDNASHRHSVDVAGVPVLESQGLAKLVEVLALG